MKKWTRIIPLLGLLCQAGLSGYFGLCGIVSLYFVCTREPGFSPIAETISFISIWTGANTFVFTVTVWALVRAARERSIDIKPSPLLRAAIVVAIGLLHFCPFGIMLIHDWLWKLHWRG